MADLIQVATNTGLFIQTTQIWELGANTGAKDSPQDFKDLIVRLHQQINNIAIVLNQKDTGYYILNEFVTGQQLFATNNTPLGMRPFFRKLVTGALPAGPTSFPHGLVIGATWTFIKIQGAASDNVGFNYYPLPFASAGGAANIEVTVDATDVTVDNNSGIAFTSSYIILEYVKS